MSTASATIGRASRADNDGTVSLRDFIVVSVQLTLLLWIVHLFKIEESYGFDRITPFVLGGFLVHAWIPMRFRAPFFVALTLGGIVAIYGFAGGLNMIALGFVLIGLAHAPVPYWMRVGGAVAIGVYLAAIRGAWFDVPGAVRFGGVVPILAAMFMFRYVLYLYDIRHEKTPPPLFRRVAYFFMLPNVCFPLFPVVDYQRFKAAYYDQDAAKIYRKGVSWMFRGVVQLLLYRVVYHYVTPSVASIDGLYGASLYVVSSYLLYLRISGLFHLIIGIMCLFGNNLPETHHRYYLASSVNDFWRRINIYWKDFMMKVVFNPIFMKLRKIGVDRAMFVATILTLIISWLLHSYQWFWLRGTFPLTPQDATFWTGLAFLVALNTLYENKYGVSAVKKPPKTLSVALKRSLQTLAMFVFMCVLWSFWTCRTIDEWTAVMKIGLGASASEFAGLALVLTIVLFVGAWAQLVAARWDAAESAKGEEVAVPIGARLWNAPWLTPAMMVALVLLGAPALQGRLNPDAAEVLQSITGDRLNEQDDELRTRGYYEELLGVESYTSAMWSVKRQTPEDWIGLRDSDAAQGTDNLLQFELKPSHSSVFKRKVLETNRFGMRDRDYELAKAEGTFRIAVVGASYTMGSGVANDELFEALAEETLNGTRQPGEPARYELLNFAVGGYSVVHSVFLLDHKVFEFEPDVVIQMATSNQDGFVEQLLRDVLRSGAEVPYPEIQDVLGRAGLTKDMSTPEMSARLAPHLEEVTAWAYRRIAETSRAHGALPVWLFLPRTLAAEDEVRRAELEGLAREAGFEVLGLDGAYEDVDPESLHIAPWDTHPNAEGHRLLAAKMAEVVRKIPKLRQARLAPN